MNTGYRLRIPVTLPMMRAERPLAHRVGSAYSSTQIVTIQDTRWLCYLGDRHPCAAGFYLPPRALHPDDNPSV
jgi:hypothetical protein